MTWTEVIREGHYGGDDWTFHDKLGSFNHEPAPHRVVSALSAESLARILRKRTGGDAAPIAGPSEGPDATSDTGSPGASPDEPSRTGTDRDVTEAT